ncbi:MAG: phosphate ABC transporter substrate-binding protein [Nitrospirae bacterium]|nr:MAG: phosphate ABC transporter substrate-binding protein [Nitrospirota bacterium]
MKNKTGAGKISLLVFVLIWLINAPAAYSSEHLIGSGCSVSNVGYLTELAKEYEKLTGIKVFVRGGGTVIGIEDLRSGKVDFAASCRPREENDPADIQFIQVAWDALVFIVHKSNTVGDISIEDVRAIYAGKITRWKQLKGKDTLIKVFISRPKKGLSGVEASTKTLVLKGLDPVETPNTMFLASTGIVEQMVEETSDGFATTGFTSAKKRDVKMLKVNGASPTNRNIINNKYQLKRPLFILIPQNPKPAVKKFVDFVLSRPGQNFIRTQGVISLLDVK